MRVDPTVFQEALDKTGCSSIDEFGWKFIDKSGTTARSYRDGKTMPGIPTLMILKRITGRSIDSMILSDDRVAA